MRSLSQESVSQQAVGPGTKPALGWAYVLEADGARTFVKFLQVKFALVLVIIRVSVRFEQCVLQCTEKICRNIVSQLKLQLNVRTISNPAAALNTLHAYR